jgi:hypothetical protein
VLNFSYPLFRRFFPELRGASIGEVLQSDAGKEWVANMSLFLAPNEEEVEDVVIPGLDPNQIRYFAPLFIKLAKEFHENKAKMNELTEALYMTMRGHNNSLLDWNEPHKPACADGAYLHAVNAALEAGGAQGLAVEIAPCHE